MRVKEDNKHTELELDLLGLVGDSLELVLDSLDGSLIDFSHCGG